MNFTDIKGVGIPDGDVRRILSGGSVLWNKSRLPQGYTEAEAIVCYSGQWINTGITMTSEDEMSIDIGLSDLTEPSFLIMGARSGFNSRNITFSKQGSGYGIACDFNDGSGNTYRYNTDRYQTGRYKLYASRNKRGVTGLGENSTVCPDTFTCAGPCCVGFWGAGSSAGSSIGVIGPIYGAEIKGKWHGIPAVKDSNGAVGMFDLVSQTFFPNAGIGSMSAIYKTFPAGYTQLRAVQATGQQWFDLGFKAKNTMRYDINIRPTARSEPNAQIWFGCYDGTVNFYMGPGGSRNWDIYYAANQNNMKITYDVSTYPLIKSCQGNPSTTASDFYCWPYTLAMGAKNYTTALNIWMFNRSSVNGQYSNLPAEATAYSARFRDGSTIIRDLVPALRQSDNVAGLLDLANNVFYRSMTGTELIPISW